MIPKTTETQISEISALLNPEPVEVETVTDTEEVDTVEEEVIDEEVIDEVPNEDEIAEDTLEDTDDETGEYDYPSDINGLAEEIDMPIEELYKLKVKLADGQEPISIAELKNERQEQLRNQARLETQIQEYETKLQTAGETSNQVQQASQARIELQGKYAEIARKYETTDWAALEQQDPGNAALLKVKFQEANDQIQNEYQQLSEYEHQAAQQAQHEFVQKAAERTMELMPTWTNDTVRNDDVNSIQELLKGEGLTEQQLKTVQDPIAIKLLVELAHYRKQFGQAEKELTKVKNAPKRFRGGARKKADKSKLTNELVAKAKNSTVATGKKQNDIAAAKAILFG